MGTRRQYTFQVKQAISQTGNVNLFPELNIPKSTAYHWIKRSIQKPVDSGYSQEKVENLITLISDLLHVVENFEIQLNEKNQSEIRVLAERFQNAPELKKVLPKKFFNRFKKDFFPCSVSVSKTCVKKYPSQLTKDEIRKMKELVTTSRFAHMPISSLAIYAQRNGMLKCGLQTWYKYISKFGWVRHYNPKKKRVIRTVGVKAKHCHEYWHMDVTQVGLKGGAKRSLQVIQDNRSRAILAWKISTTVKAKDSENLITKANSRYSKEYKYKPTLLTDGGPENKVKKLPFIRTKLARKEIRFANTMVEVFFKTLKSQFLSYQTLSSEKDLTDAIEFFIQQYNEVIPRKSLGGLTPNEVLYGEFDCQMVEYLSSKRQSRERENRLIACNKCVS